MGGRRQRIEEAPRLLGPAVILPGVCNNTCTSMMYIYDVQRPSGLYRSHPGCYAAGSTARKTTIDNQQKRDIIFAAEYGLNYLHFGRVWSFRVCLYRDVCEKGPWVYVFNKVQILAFEVSYTVFVTLRRPKASSFSSGKSSPLFALKCLVFRNGNGREGCPTKPPCDKTPSTMLNFGWHLTVPRET